MLIERALSDFAGRWCLDKQITPTQGPCAVFEGTATWRPVEAGLAYEEYGRLWIGDAAPLEAERRYLWTPTLDVLFDDGRFFHTVPRAGGRAHHVCPPDDYVVEYGFADWPTFTAVWHVVGPRKDYVMTARYRR